MTRFIYKYLSAYFVVKFGVICPRDDFGMYIAHPVPSYYTADKLAKELFTIFDLTKKQLKYYVKGWALKQDKNFAFDKFWCRIVIDAEEELSALLAQEIATEVDRQIMRDIMIAAEQHNDRD